MYSHITTEITSQPVRLTTIMALEDVTLNCSSSVDGVTYSWHHSNGSVLSRNTNTFIIHKATPYDEGEYYCKASKEKISVKSNRAVVKVDGRIY